MFEKLLIDPIDSYECVECVKNEQRVQKRNQISREKRILFKKIS